jgi:uncharacterized protein YdcH (DUF465 family)
MTDLTVKDLHRDSLAELHEWLYHQISGYEEDKGHDQKISRFLEAVDWALRETR